ncbi:MAG: nitroreductase [Alphaproteobacteria bacterium]
MDAAAARKARIAETPPSAPRTGERLPRAEPDPVMLETLLTRRSTVANSLGPPGPAPRELKDILRAAARVPDHGKLAPWRFVVFTGRARAEFGEVLAKAWAAQDETASEERLALERGRFLRAPVVVAVISRVRENHKIPEWEQILSAGAACQTMLLAARASGYDGQWITEWYAYDPLVRRALGMEAGERVAGFIYMGTAKDAPLERARPDLTAVMRNWRPGRGA